MYHLECKYMLKKDDEFILGEGRARLLRLIMQKGSIRGAAEEMNMSYRHSWGMIKKIEEALGEKVVETKRGGKKRGGSKLTPVGEEILSDFEEMKERHGDKQYKNPSLTVDGIITDEDRILLIKRRNPPFQGRYALPGGFVEYGETVEEAVVREIEEETGLRTAIDRLVGVYSDPERDPRGHMISVVFDLEVKAGKPTGGSDAESASYLELNDLPKLAFDHSRIISDYLFSSGDQSVSDSGSPQ